ncbi:MAG: haloacid dehalogenase-like hydrolase [Acidobacteriota bacterium]|nr:haloacid dehalogenase-like hydrolase [Acidobacteriota bacterium]
MYHCNLLVLFDIDGTLVRRAGMHHRQALVEAVRLVAGLDTTTENIPLHGILDRDILRQMMSNAGASSRSIARHMPKIVEQAQRIYVRTCPDLRGKTCPGVRRFLYNLKRRRIPSVLVTGNLTRIGWKKLERAGLKDYFRFGAFAEMADDRAGLARIAIQTARDRKWIAGDARIWLIGDAPSDIIAAKANGATAVAVHTGISTRDELAAHSPDLLIEDLRSLTIKMLLADLQ